MKRQVVFIIFATKLVLSFQSIHYFNQVEEHFNQNDYWKDAGNVDFKFASYYGDHMVLQRSPRRANIWGFSPTPGEEIRVDFGGHSYSAVVQPNNVWSILLDPVKYPGPYEITAVSNISGKISLKDVLFGDVWICSGQSNMEFTLSQAFNASEEIKDANKYQHIRLFTVRQFTSSSPLSDLRKDGILEPWSNASDKSVGGEPWKYFSAVCWLYGKHLYQQLGYPVGLIDTNWPGTPVEAWSSSDALKVCFKGAEKSELHHKVRSSTKLSVSGPLHRPADDPSPGSNTVLWNAMVHPLLNMTIYGAIWYQGEENTLTNTHFYNCTFPSMITDWRSKWNEGSKGQTDKLFPFGFVQLAPNQPSAQEFKGFSEIRWHQTADFGFVPNPFMPKTFMSVALDLPDFLSPWGSIHPRDKQDVAARLVLGSLAVAYNQTKVHFQGPFPSQFVTNTANKSIQVIYLQQDNITVTNYAGFEICCSLGSKQLNNKTAWWLQAPVTKITVDSVYIATDDCPTLKVVGVRYSWRVSPCMFKKCAIYSTSGLPAAPFQFTSWSFSHNGTYIVDRTVPHPIET